MLATDCKRSNRCDLISRPSNVKLGACTPHPIQAGAAAMDPRTLVVLSDSAATADPCSSFNYVGDIGQPVLATHQITKLKPIFEKIEVSTAQMYPKVRGTARDDGVIGKSRYKSDLTSVLKRRSTCSEKRRSFYEEARA